MIARDSTTQATPWQACGSVLDGLDVVFIRTVANVIHAFGEVEATGSAEPDGEKLEA